MSHKIIKDHYEECLSKYGPNSTKALDWSNQEDIDKRYQIMIDIRRSKKPCSLLDFGCGLGGLGSFIDNKYLPINYTGIDISNKFIQEAQKALPLKKFESIDILETPEELIKLGFFDYIVCNGTFQVKRELLDLQMTTFMYNCLCRLWNQTKIGLSFNIMNRRRTDPRRTDLNAWTLIELEDFVGSFTNNFVIRSDYLPYEFTCYMYKESI